MTSTDQQRLTDGINSLIGELTAPPDPHSAEQRLRARARSLARAATYAIDTAEQDDAAAIISAAITASAEGAGTVLAAEHLADLITCGLTPMDFPQTDGWPEAAATAALIINGRAADPMAASAALERIRLDDALARKVLALLATHAVTVIAKVSGWIDAAGVDYLDHTEGTDTSINRADV